MPKATSPNKHVFKEITVTLDAQVLLDEWGKWISTPASQRGNNHTFAIPGNCVHSFKLNEKTLNETH